MAIWPQNTHKTQFAKQSEGFFLHHLEDLDHDVAGAERPVLHGVVEVPEDRLLAHGVVDGLGKGPCTNDVCTEGGSPICDQ